MLHICFPLFICHVTDQSLCQNQLDGLIKDFEQIGLSLIGIVNKINHSFTLFVIIIDVVAVALALSKFGE